MSISAGLLLLAAAQGSPWVDPAPTGRWAGSTKELAAYLLPPEMAADVVSHTVDHPIFEGGLPYLVRFAGRSRPSGRGLCERYGYNVFIGGEDKGHADRRPPMRSTKIRLGDCPIATDAIFADINPDDGAGARLAFGWIDWARREASSSRPLPFKIACRSETDEDRCADGGRKALAELPIDKTYGARRKAAAPAHHWEFWVTETEPGQKLWDVKIDATPGKASIDLVWLIPPPF